MKKIIVACSILQSLSFLSQESTAKWRAKPILIDGIANDWSLPLRFYGNETNLFFAIANDSSNLFLCFQAKDEQTQLKINEAGMKIELKAKGKLKCDATIDFPLTVKKENTDPSAEHKKQKPDIEHLKTGYILQNVNLSVKGFATQKGLVPIKDSAGINAAILWDNKNVMTYELRIPLTELFGTAFSLKEVTKAITMKVIVNGFERPPVTDNGNASSSMAGNTMGGGTGAASGGMGGSMGGGNSGGGQRKESDPMFESTSMKQNFLLATGPTP